jgi:hypothetical protein
MIKRQLGSGDADSHTIFDQIANKFTETFGGMNAYKRTPAPGPEEKRRPDVRRRTRDLRG